MFEMSSQCSAAARMRAFDRVFALDPAIIGEDLETLLVVRLEHFRHAEADRVLAQSRRRHSRFLFARARCAGGRAAATARNSRGSGRANSLRACI